MTKEFRENEIEDLHVAIAHTSNRRGAIDVGANEGVWTRVLSEHFEQVLAIEPVEKFYERLEDNTSDLHNVTRHYGAVGETDKMVGLKVKKQAARVTLGEGDTHMVPLDRLAPLTISEPIDLIKTDCEGYDLNVLFGATAIIQVYKPTLIIEYHLLEKYQQSERMLENYLHRYGYSVVYKVWPNLIALHKSSQ